MPDIKIYIVSLSNGCRYLYHIGFLRPSEKPPLRPPPPPFLRPVRENSLKTFPAQQIEPRVVEAKHSKSMIKPMATNKNVCNEAK